MADAACLVCETVSRGQHFGVLCCRACAAFFRRTNQLQLKYKCRFNQNCDLSQKNRYTCRHCRYKKCITVGMNAEGAVPMDNDPPVNIVEAPVLARPIATRCGVKINEIEPSNRIPTIVKNQNFAHPLAVMTVPTSAAQAEFELHANIQIFLKTRIDALFMQSSRVHSFPYSIPLSLCQQALVAYANHNAMWPNCTPEKIFHSNSVDISKFMQSMYMEIEYLATFCLSIEPFVQLPFDQKWLIFKHFWPCFMELDRAHVTCKLLGYDPADKRQIAYDGTVMNFSTGVTKLETMTDLNEHQIRDLMRGSEEVTIKLFMVPFKKFAPDEFELMYMGMSMMWNVKSIDNISADTLAIADNVTRRISEDLYNYYAFELNKPNFADRIYKLSHLVSALDRVNDLKKEDSHMSKTFNIFKHDVFMEGLKL